MNAEEAKVPDVEGRWQSIEIFLFSNGQQYSPPRKYHLRAEELTFWEDTLDLLAQSHYGPESPLIDLYTTDGHLVKGPLELKNGLAYVAVTPPDTFIDAGYQKYLIRASRSWEKRQVRKKIPDCVQEDLCCLCPEKEWCCDIQTCCLCPEKEGEPLEPLYCPAEHPELRPGGGHFMSSAPSKPASSPYRIRSGKIASSAGENAVRPMEYGANPDEFGYSPLEASGILNESVAKYEAIPRENTPKMNENSSGLEIRASPVNYGTSPSEFQTKPDENVATVTVKEVYSGEYGTTLNENGATPGEYVASLSKNELRLSKDGARLRGYGTKLVENGTIPVEYDTKPSVNRAKPGEYKARSGINEAMPSEYSDKPVKYERSLTIQGARLSVNVARSNENYAREAHPGEYKTRLSINEDKQSKHDKTKPRVHGARHAWRVNEARNKVNEARHCLNIDKSGEYESRPTVDEPMLSEHRARRSVNGANPSEYGARTDEFSDNRSRSDGYEPRSNESRACSDEDHVKPIVHEIIPGNDKPYFDKIESKKEANEVMLYNNKISLGDNVDRLKNDAVDKEAGKEYKIEQTDKQIDPKGRMNGNGAGVGLHKVSDAKQSREKGTVNRMIEPRSIEAENAHKPFEVKSSEIENKRRQSQQRGQIEHTPRLRRQAGAEMEQKGRTAELTRESELDSRMSDQKDREINSLGKVGVNTAKLSEQRNKILGGHESRAGDHENKAGDLGLKTGNYNGGLVNPGSKGAGNGSRPAGSRASPRERMSSIEKTSNLDQLKLGTPGTRVDETAAKLGESKIKSKVGYPGARQSTVGGTVAAGASHMSDTQQQIRRTSLSAGRASIEKKRMSIGQNSSLLKKPTPISSVLRKSEDKQPIKTSKDILAHKMIGKVCAIPVSIASNDVGESKTMQKDSYKPVIPPALQSTSITNLKETNKAPLEMIIDDKENLASTHLFRELESEIRSMKFDTVKQNVDVIKNSPEETQTELVYVGKSMAPVTVNEGVQTDTEPVKQEIKNQEVQGQEVSASSKAKDNSCTCICSICCKRDHRVATIDPDENTIITQNKGDVINIKLNIKVRNAMRSDYPCQKNAPRSRSLTNFAASEKESQMSIDNDMIVQRKNSLQSKSNHQQFQSNGYGGSSRVMVVQCAGCGRLNYPPQSDQPPCCDDNKKYFILLTNSVYEEDMDDMCNFNPPCQPLDLRRPQLRKSGSGIPLKQALSEMTLDAITTVTVSGVPLQRRELVKITDTACQTEEPQGECISKRKVSISEALGMRCDQKESCSSLSVTMQDNNTKTKHSCRKLCPQRRKNEDTHVCLECPPVTSCPKVQSVCSHVSSEGCPQVQSQGCHQTSTQIQSRGCVPVSPQCSPCCPKPLLSVQATSQVSDAQTQTHWSSIVLQARLHPDGRYSFHLPPLNVLNSYPF